MSGDPVVRSNEKLITVHFESTLDFLEYQETGFNASGHREHTNRNSYKSKIEWYGATNANVGAVIDHSVTGDSVLYSSLEKMVSEMRSMDGLDQVNYKQRIKSTRRKFVRGYQGDEIDIHRVYAGSLDTAWSSRIREVTDKEHNLITLHIDIGGNQNVRVRESLWRTVVALRVYDDLIKAGKSVKIIVGGCSTGSFVQDARGCAVSVTVKEYGDSLSLERLAAMSHIGFYRVFGFAAKYCQSIARLNYSLGYSTDANDEKIALNIQDEIAQGHTKIVYIGRSTSRYEAQLDLDKVYKQLKNLGGEK